MGIKLLNVDCMEYMRGIDDNYFDLAIVDPPYGIKRFSKENKGSKNRVEKHFKTGSWNNLKIDEMYISELFRVSRNQIIWGFNHFCSLLPDSQGFIYWHKHQNGNFAEGELAWSSTGNGRFFDRKFQLDTGNKINPAQKPVQLYKWILENYAERDYKILDTHLGSASSAIAAHQLGYLNFSGCEIDDDFFKSGLLRFKEETAQRDMFAMT